MLRHLFFLISMVLMVLTWLPTCFAAENRPIKADEIRNVRKAPQTKTHINTKNIETFKPDLTITDMNITPANPKKGQKVIFTAKVLNKGVVDAPWHQASIRVGGETSSPPISVQALSPNASKQIARQLTINRPGRFRVTFIADASGAVTESNENNNSKYMDFVVEDRLPDLTLVDPEFSPANPKVGDTVVVQATSKNIGDIMAGSHHNGIRIGSQGQPTIIGSADYLHVGTQGVVARAWSPTQPGTYIVRLYIDVNDEVEEHQENNNMVSFTITVTP